MAFTRSECCAGQGRKYVAKRLRPSRSLVGPRGAFYSSHSFYNLRERDGEDKLPTVKGTTVHCAYIRRTHRVALQPRWQGGPGTHSGMAAGRKHAGRRRQGKARIDQKDLSLFLQTIL